MMKVQLIISANGCGDMEKYMSDIPYDDLIWEKDPVGFPSAINSGIKLAYGEFTILLNNDSILKVSPFSWIDMLLEPFNDEKVGITGPAGCHAQIFDNHTRQPILDKKFISFACAAIRTKLFEEIGTLDEVFNPGCGEDVDFCIRAQNKGYDVVKIPDENFPMIHLGAKTLKNPILMSRVPLMILNKWWYIIKDRYVKGHPDWYGGLSCYF